MLLYYPQYLGGRFLGFGISFSTGLIKQFSTCPEKHTEQFVLKRINFSKTFGSYVKDLLVFNRSSWSKVVTKAIHVLKGPIWAKTFLSKKFIILKKLWDIAWSNFEFSAKIFMQSCRNCIVHIRMFFLGENVFLVLLNCSLKKSSLDFRRISLGKVAKMAFYLSIGTLWGKRFVFEKFVFSKTVSDIA